ncbi:YqaJ viral recombinase family protein [Nonomuraea sp. PA05]|uniref:YqaJ viral recombinase family protein n=1 Tax=Nonomuraea sp. PA05 TaxID=2604466 RepID=UPI0016527A83|nr:YqaJ viral recombinase family protein [Nonomuraea sp. PA05]
MSTVTDTLEFLGRFEPGSPEWLAARTGPDGPRLGGTDAGALVGANTFISPYGLAMILTGRAEREETSDDAERGYLLEPSLAAYFRKMHPEWEIVDHPGTYARGWKLANPDALVYQGGRLVAGGEYKSARYRDEWGEPGTDEIPLGYWVQVMWYLHIFGLAHWYVVMIGPGLEFAEYVVEYDEEAARALVAQAAEFRTNLLWGIKPPLDHHPHTYRTLRAAHPEIDESLSISVSDPVGIRYVNAEIAAAAAENELLGAKAAIADEMGRAKKAYLNGQVIATRRRNRGPHPHVQAVRNLHKIKLPALEGDPDGQ